MKSPQWSWRLFTILVVTLLFLAACGDDEDSGPVLAPGSEPVSAQVNLSWQQVGATDLKVLSANTFRTGAGEYVYLVGEAENTTGQPLQNLQVKVKAYNDRGEEVDSREAPALLQAVGPGEKIPFNTAMDAREVERYEIEVTGEPVQEEPAHKLEIRNDSMTEPKSGYVWFEGEVANVSDAPAEKVRVVAVLYDADGNVVEAASQQLEGTIEPGGTLPFKFIANHRDAASQKLMVDAQ